MALPHEVTEIEGVSRDDTLLENEGSAEREGDPLANGLALTAALSVPPATSGPPDGVCAAVGEPDAAAEADTEALNDEEWEAEGVWLPPVLPLGFPEELALPVVLPVPEGEPE